MVLNNKPGISEETRERVMSAVRAEGYNLRKNAPASRRNKENVSLIIFKKHGKVVGDTPFFSTLIESIEKEAVSEGYRLSIRYVNAGAELGEFDRTSRENLLILGTEMDENDLKPFMGLDASLVVLDNGFPGFPVNTVSIDNVGGTVSAVRHLIESGHTKIGYLGSSIPIRNFAERFRGYELALAERSFRPVDIISLESTMEGAYRDMKKWLSENKLTATAFAADNDFIALGAIRAIRENGLTLGRDISVVGFDDLPFARMGEPPLTTVRVFNDVMGADAFRRLTEIIRNPGVPFSHTQIGTALKSRHSVVAL
jgi:LacI family transcriptional regulator